MYKIFLITILLVFNSCITAQNNDPITSKPLIDFPTISGIADGDYVGLWDVSKNDLFKGTVYDLYQYIDAKINVNGNRTITADWSFTGKLTIPSSLSASTTNGIAIVSNKLSFSNGAVIEYAATESWVADYIAANGIEGDLSIYSQKAANETWTGAKTLNNLLDLRGGSLRLPYKTSPIVLSGNQDVYVNADGTVRFSTKDADNNKYDGIFASREWVLANVSVTGLSSTTAQTNITSSLTWNGGYINLAASKLIIPERASTGYGDLTYNLDNGYYGGLYYANGIFSPSSESVDGRIASKVNYTPYTIPASAIDIGQNYNVYQKTVTTETTFTFSNTTNKRLELWISNSGLSYIHFAAPSGYTIVYPDGFSQPFTGLHLYSIMIHNNKIFIRKDMTTAL